MARSGERKERFTTQSNLSVEALYHGAEVDPGVGEPGEFPFVRGIHRTMYRGRLWTMRQYAGFGTAREANARYRYLLSQGQTGLSVAFDLPTQMGRDSDHPLVRGEVGRVGVAISTVEDMEQLLEGIPLEKASISMTINSTAVILLGFLLVVAERRGVPWDALRGTLQNDILKEYIARGTYIYPPRPALRLVTDIFDFCTSSVKNFNTISISGYHIREAGSTAVEEVAFTLADAIAYVEGAIARGLSVDDFAPRLAFFFNCHNNFLEEIAKFRAARGLWAEIMRDRFKAKDPASMMLRFHTQTAGSSLTAQQPYNNVVRTTIQALAAVLGGTQSLHTNSFDEALGLPTEESALLALRTQQVIASESGVADSVDPLGGSYLIESWTARIQDEVRQRLARIDAMGGMLAAIEAGYPQGEIERSAYAYQRSVETRELEVVGVNCYQQDETIAPPVMHINPAFEREQVDRLRAYKLGRDGAQVAKTLAALSEVGSGTGCVVPLVVEAVRCNATLGEISDVFRNLWGEHHDSGIRS
jgi:methylmalonyl-CoA mutase N-terminal domain/subunit